MMGMALTNTILAMLTPPSAGPTAVVLKQVGQWTIGASTNHISPSAGKGARSNISAAFVNSFISRASKSAFSAGLLANMSDHWKSEKLTMPLTLSALQITKMGSQITSIGGAQRHYVARFPLMVWRGGWS